MIKFSTIIFSVFLVFESCLATISFERNIENPTINSSRRQRINISISDSSLPQLITVNDEPSILYANDIVYNIERNQNPILRWEELTNYDPYMNTRFDNNDRLIRSSISQPNGLYTPDSTLTIERDLRTPEHVTFTQPTGDADLFYSMQGRAARIISIDGGGIRGLIPVTWLSKLESEMREKSISDTFHMFAGTSTGGILAAGYNIPDAINPRRPKYNSTDLQTLYLEKGAEIFTRKFGHLGGIGGPKYQSENAYAVFSELVGNTKLSELSNDVLIPWYNIEARQTRFFKNYVARLPQKNVASDYYVRDVLAATSAAPTYFKSREIRTVDEIQRGVSTSTHAVDGGLGCNNPVMCAFTDANKIYPKAETLFVLRMGTGKYTDHSNPYYGFEWISHITDILMGSNSEMGLYSLKNNGTIYNKRVIYCDLQIELPKENSAMDNVDPNNMNRLKGLATEDSDIVRKIELIAPALSLPKTPRQNLVLQNGETITNNFYQIL